MAIRYAGRAEVSSQWSVAGWGYYNGIAYANATIAIVLFSSSPGGALLISPGRQPWVNRSTRQRFNATTDQRDHGSTRPRFNATTVQRDHGSTHPPSRRSVGAPRSHRASPWKNPKQFSVVGSWVELSVMLSASVIPACRESFRRTSDNDGAERGMYDRECDHRL
jgi:hypothetical protein